MRYRQSAFLTVLKWYIIDNVILNCFSPVGNYINELEIHLSAHYTVLIWLAVVIAEVTRCTFVLKTNRASRVRKKTSLSQ